MLLDHEFTKGERLYMPGRDKVYIVARVEKRRIRVRDDARTFHYFTSKRQACLHLRPIQESICWICLVAKPDAHHSMICDRCRQTRSL